MWGWNHWIQIHLCPGLLLLNPKGGARKFYMFLEFPSEDKGISDWQFKPGYSVPGICNSNNWIFVLVPHSYIIPCTFRGLHTVYASCNLTESCFFTVLTPAAKRKIGSNNPLLVPKLLLLNEHILPAVVWLIPAIPISNSSKEFCCSKDKNWYSFKIYWQTKAPPCNSRCCIAIQLHSTPKWHWTSSNFGWPWRHSIP